MASSVGSIPTQLSQAVPATFRLALFVAVTAGLGYGFDSYAVNIYGLVLPDIKKTLHITDAEAGYIGSIFLLGYTIGTIGFGFAADRWGRKTTLAASILLYGVTTALAGLTTNIAAFAGLRFLTGVGGAGEQVEGRCDRVGDRIDHQDRAIAEIGAVGVLSVGTELQTFW
jgi:putative MFS transporter